MWKLAIRNIFRHRVRTALTLVAIVFGVAGLVLTGGFVEDIYVQLRETTIRSQLGHIQVYRAGYYERGRSNPHEYMIDNPRAVAEKLAANREIADVLVRVSFSGLLGNGRSDFPVIGEGVEPGKEANLGTIMSLTAGRELRDEDKYGMVVGKGLAQTLKLKPGDFATIVLNTPGGALNTLEFEVVGVFQTMFRDYDDRAVRISLPAAQELLATESAHSLVVFLGNTSATRRVAQQIASVLPPSQFEVKRWDELADFYQKTVDLYKGLFTVLQLIALCMVLLSVVNSVNMSVFERTAEFGTMRALGNRGRQVFGLILTESALLGLIGGVIGIVLGAILAAIVSKAGIPMPPPPNSDIGYTAYIRVVPGVLLTAFLVGWLGTVFAALLPARRAARLDVSEALRHA
jgi:putative ABC transport system permease protein